MICPHSAQISSKNGQQVPKGGGGRCPNFLASKFSSYPLVRNELWIVSPTIDQRSQPLGRAGPLVKNYQPKAWVTGQNLQPMGMVGALVKQAKFDNLFIKMCKWKTSSEWFLAFFIAKRSHGSTRLQRNQPVGLVESGDENSTNAHRYFRFRCRWRIFESFCIVGQGGGGANPSSAILLSGRA